MNLVLRTAIGIVVAVIVYLVLTAIIHFRHADLIFGLVALVVLLAIMFAPLNYRGRSL